MLRLAQIWQDFQQARISVARLGDILNTAARAAYTGARRAAGDPGRRHVRACRASATPDGPAVLTMSIFDVRPAR